MIQKHDKTRVSAGAEAKLTLDPHADIHSPRTGSRESESSEWERNNSSSNNDTSSEPIEFDEDACWLAG